MGPGNAFDAESGSGTSGSLATKTSFNPLSIAHAVGSDRGDLSQKRLSRKADAFMKAMAAFGLYAVLTLVFAYLTD